MGQMYKLDNAAKLFPAVTKKSNTSIYRIGAVLKEAVDADVLQRAVDLAMRRYPLLSIRFCSGTFWNYMVPNETSLTVNKESAYPCAPMSYRENDGHFVRVLHYGSRIAVEIFHSLTDGFGAVEFLKTLLYEYFLLHGRKIDHEGMVLLPDDAVDARELEDSFEAYYDKKIPPNRSKIVPSMRITGTPFLYEGNRLIQGVYDAKLLNGHAKKQGATLTQYLTTVFLYAIYMEYMQHGEQSDPVVISVPVNLRQIFPSISLKNFFSVVNIGIYAQKSLAFEDVLQNVATQFAEKMRKENLAAAIAENYNVMAHPGVKYAPLFLKNAGTKFVFAKWGENCKTATLSNLGNIKLPSSMLPFVERIETVLYPTPKSPLNCGLCSAAGRLVITFTTTILETGVIRRFFALIAEQSGYYAEIFANEWSLEHE